MRIALISMPMVSLQTPAFGLTRLKSVLEKTFTHRISCEIYHLHHDFATHIGPAFYDFIVNEMNSGLGEWFFRQIAFPNAADNTDAYFRHYFLQNDEDTRKLREVIIGKRKLLAGIFEHLIRVYRLHDADMVGFSSLFYQNAASMAMARKLKKKNRQIITLMGGANVEFPMGLPIIRDFEYIDYIFSGPALISLPEFVRYRLNGEDERCHQIRGVWSRQNIGDHSHTTVTDFSYGERADINLPLELDYDSFLDSYEKYFPDSEHKPFIFFSTSEGCHWGETCRCTFCAQGGPCGNNMKFSCMTPDHAVETIRSLGKYAGRVGFLYATDSILAKHYPEAVFSNIRSKIPIHLEMNVRYTDEAQIRILSRAGVRIVEAGIESLSTKSLQLMRKGVTAFQNLKFMMDCMMNDILVTWNFLIGLPGESGEIYEKLCSDILKLTHFPPGQPAVVTFERFSAYHDTPEDYGLNLVPYPFYALTYPFDRETISEIAYNFSDTGVASYRTALAAWHDNLNAVCRYWKSLWNKKNRTFPCLYFERRGGDMWITDSRTGEEREYPVSETSVHLLQILKRPRTIRSLTETNPGMDMGREMRVLIDKALVFHEEDRYFNIVFPGRPPVPSFL